jgi:hypothetical protein
MKLSSRELCENLLGREFKDTRFSSPYTAVS